MKSSQQLNVLELKTVKAIVSWRPSDPLGHVFSRFCQEIMIPGNYCVIVYKMVGRYSIIYLIVYQVILCLGRVSYQGYPTVCIPWLFGNDHLSRSVLKERRKI